MDITPVLALGFKPLPTATQLQQLPHLKRRSLSLSQLDSMKVLQAAMWLVMNILPIAVLVIRGGTVEKPLSPKPEREWHHFR
jgi:hypothetical protein